MRFAEKKIIGEIVAAGSSMGMSTDIALIKKQNTSLPLELQTFSISLLYVPMFGDTRTDFTVPQ